MGAAPLRLEIAPDPEAVARRVAAWLLSRAREADGIFALVLSGGSTPRRLYEEMARDPTAGQFPWSRTHWFFGDERFVPTEDPRSNYRMAREALLGRAPIPPENIHRIPTEGVDPDGAARAYERELQAFYGAEGLDRARPLFDVTLLGLGPDGHTASLFPGMSVLAEQERWVAAVAGAKPEARVTLTYPALDASREAVFLVTGAEKRPILARFLERDPELPACGVNPIDTLWVFADAAAVRDRA